jgi:hypothetical protein
MSVGLIRYDAARQALAEAHRVDEVKDIRDKAVAMQAYAKQAKDTDLITQATEIRMRAERRAGQLAQMKERKERDTGKGNRNPALKSQAATPKLGDFGVTKTQSSRWQKLATLDDKTFETKVENASQRAYDGIVNGLVRDIVPEGTDEEATPSADAPTIMLKTHLGKEVPYKPPERPTFNKTNQQVDWASWTWNPVTGCLHGCPYCYAREMAVKPSYKATYPVGFTPLFHHERLDAPAHTKVPDEAKNDPRLKRVFVCSMADLYGRWVPTD